MKFSHKLALMLSAVAVLPVAVISVTHVRTQREMLTAHIRESHLALAQSLADEFRYTIQHIRRDLTATGAVLNTPPLGENDVLTLLDAYLKENTMVRAVGMYDVRGTLIETMTKNPAVPSELPSQLPATILTKLQSLEATAQPISTVWWSVMPTATQTPSPITSDTARGVLPFIPIVVTVRGHRFSGRLAVMLARQDCAAFMSASALRAFGVERGVIHCVDSDCRLVASTEGGAQSGPQGAAQTLGTAIEDVLRKQFFTPSRSGTVDDGNTDAAKNTTIALQNTTYFQSIGVSQEYANARGEKVVATKTTVPFTNLSLIIEQPEAVVFASLRGMQIQLLFACLVVCAGALGLGYYLSARLLHPLRQLTEAASALKQQNFHLRLHREENDEFAFLFGVYNEAASQLEQYQRLDVSTLLTERNKLEVIMRQAAHGVLVLTPERSIMLANDTLAGYLRQDPIELEGRIVDEALRAYAPLLVCIDQAFADTSTSQETSRTEDLVLTPLGETTPRIFQATLNRIILDRQFVAMVVSLVDCGAKG